MGHDPAKRHGGVSRVTQVSHCVSNRFRIQCAIPGQVLALARAIVQVKVFIITQVLPFPLGGSERIKNVNVNVWPCEFAGQ